MAWSTGLRHSITAMPIVSLSSLCGVEALSPTEPRLSRRPPRLMTVSSSLLSSLASEPDLDRDCVLSPTRLTPPLLPWFVSSIGEEAPDLAPASHVHGCEGSRGDKPSVLMLVPRQPARARPSSMLPPPWRPLRHTVSTVLSLRKGQG